MCEGRIKPDSIHADRFCILRYLQRTDAADRNICSLPFHMIRILGGARSIGIVFRGTITGIDHDRCLKVISDLLEEYHQIKVNENLVSTVFACKFLHLKVRRKIGVTLGRDRVFLHIDSLCNDACSNAGRRNCADARAKSQSKREKPTGWSCNEARRQLAAAATANCANSLLPEEQLRDLTIIDTPGLNDPIVSRTMITKQFLKECDVAILLSPCSQFMDEKNIELMATRMPDSGISNIIVVGSKLDSGIAMNKGKNMSFRDGKGKKNPTQIERANENTNVENKLKDIRTRLISMSHCPLAARGFRALFCMLFAFFIPE